MKGLNDQKILVTGASRGIGRAIAEYLLNEGAEVGLHYRSGRSEVEDILRRFDQHRCHVFQADLGDTQQTLALMDQVIDKMDGLTSIVINAGVFIPHSVDLPMEDWLEIWKKTLKINLESAAILTKKCLSHFSRQKEGRLIYIGSRAAFRGETEDYLAYAASKGGLTSLAKSVARSFGKDNIKSFVVAPGFIRTRMAEEAISKLGEKKVLENLALNTLTKPEDIAPLVGLMCSGQMDHATGTTVDVNGGSHIR